jgi:hypothetical protein
MSKLTSEEKKRRANERKKKKWNDTHKLIEGVDHKLCNICNLWLPSTEEYFYKNKANSIDGLHPYCKECTIAKSLKGRMENHEEYLDYMKEYNVRYLEIHENKMYHRERSKKSREKGTQKQWQKNNPDKIRGYHENREHKNHDISDHEWEDCKIYFDNRCAYCGLHIDEHFIIYASKPKKTDLHREHVDDKGSNKLDNCIPSCQSCNTQKWMFNLEDWYNESNINYTKERILKINKWLEDDCYKYMESI